MTVLKLLLASFSVTTVIASASTSPAAAGDANNPPPAVKTMSPISGHGAVPGRQVLLNFRLGPKQAVSYFQNESGACRLTVMVGDAFNGEDVPDLTTVRFEATVGSGASARFDVAQGKSLEYSCDERAEAMSVKELDRVAHFAAENR